MRSPIKAYESVSVDTIENLLRFMEEAWMHGFPLVRKEDGRSQRQLEIHAALLLLSATHCISREQVNSLETINSIKEQLKNGGRLADDTAFFLEKVRSPERYTRESVMKRKKNHNAQVNTLPPRQTG
ncbi:MAG: hypothetical protein OQL16_09305 [Gammaproteobacteria bacterium]|nr:hypothetical protein [Gammaproteobacteria bacterium]